MLKTIQIEGMTCGHCKARVEKALVALNGVTQVKVDLETNSATCEVTSVTDEMLKETVEDSGYDVVSIT